jgi:dTMP kinase
MNSKTTGTARTKTTSPRAMTSGPRARTPSRRPTNAPRGTPKVRANSRSNGVHQDGSRAPTDELITMAPNAVSPYRGALIAVEGVDGSGKSTQVHLLHEWLKGMGCKVHFSTWNSSDMVRSATKRGKKEQLLTPTTFSLIHATDFADRYERQILPRLQAGYIVLCDRYIYTAFARDGVRGCDPAWLRTMYSFARKPDVTLHFSVPLQMSLDRILAGRPDLKYHEAGMDLNLHPDIKESYKLFQGRIHKLYQGMSKEFGFTVVDSSGEIHGIQEGVRATIASRIDLASFQTRSRVFKGGSA